MRRRQVTCLTLALTSICLASCASLFAKKSDTIKIESDPPGAEVSIEGQKFGVTPVSVEVRRDTFAQKYITLKKRGYKTKRIFIEKTIDKTAFFNLGFISTTSGATSWGIDALTGAMFEYQPGFYSIDLEPKDETTEAREQDHVPTRDDRQLFVEKSFTQLKRDISAGTGEWLNAYLEMRHNKGSKAKMAYLNAIQSQKEELIRSESPAELFKILEGLQG